MNLDFLFEGERFKKLGEYTFDKLIFSIYILLLLVSFLTVFLFYGGDKSDHIYFNCPKASTGCENPFQNNHPVCERVWNGACDQEYIPAGFTYGKPIPFVVKHWGLFVGMGLVACFVVNHFLHNRGKRLELEVDE